MRKLTVFALAVSAVFLAASLVYRYKNYRVVETISLSPAAVGENHEDAGTFTPIMWSFSGGGRLGRSIDTFGDRPQPGECYVQQVYAVDSGDTNLVVKMKLRKVPCI